MPGLALEADLAHYAARPDCGGAMAWREIKKASSLAVKSKTLVEVVSPGLEPGQAEPKTVVLPLHHETIRGSSYQW